MGEDGPFDACFAGYPCDPARGKVPGGGGIVGEGAFDEGEVVAAADGTKLSV
ncbi:MAG: hypothetical protein AVDCRST_MAG14-226 [uncultured Rubrobacteraceae bacterium]|uniref:Uncharacterized protein n=1 Tax=uncultured Rubrobacteraceae bacterium TaxID=349277 RepID=A0A6J4QGF4_9ACTN|nr:MAG: hypothetical protein AVDCRST_MAG14-226 [uncultured Rubrobacteraceae bacterium]